MAILGVAFLVLLSLVGALVLAVRRSRDPVRAGLWSGLAVSAFGLILAFMGGTGRYPGVGPESASDSTPATVFGVGIIVVIAGLVVSLISTWHAWEGGPEEPPR